MQTETATLSVAQPQVNKKATWALISGVVGLVVFPLLFSTVAIALGVVAKGEIDRDGSLEGRSRASTAIVLGVIGLGIAAIVIATQVIPS